MAADRQQQIAQAEELLADRPTQLGFAKGLFFGEYLHEALLPYPLHDHDDRTDWLVADLRKYLTNHVDPVTIDREARIPDDVIAGLGKLGILGPCLPKSCGGLQLSQTSYCRLLEVLGAHCGSTALFVERALLDRPPALVSSATASNRTATFPSSLPASGSVPLPSPNPRPAVTPRRCVGTTRGRDDPTGESTRSTSKIQGRHRSSRLGSEHVHRDGPPGISSTTQGAWV